MSIRLDERGLPGLSSRACCGAVLRLSSSRPLGGLHFSLDDVEDFAPVDRYFRWVIDAQAHSIAADFENVDRNIVADDDALACFAREDNHCSPPPFG